MKAYLKTNAYQKAKDKAALSREDQIALFEESRKKALEALEILQKQTDELARLRGFKVPDR